MPCTEKLARGPCDGKQVMPLRVAGKSTRHAHRVPSCFHISMIIWPFHCHRFCPWARLGVQHGLVRAHQAGQGASSLWSSSKASGQLPNERLQDVSPLQAHKGFSRVYRVRNWSRQLAHEMHVLAGLRNSLYMSCARDQTQSQTASYIAHYVALIRGRRPPCSFHAECLFEGREGLSWGRRKSSEDHLP